MSSKRFALWSSFGVSFITNSTTWIELEKQTSFLRSASQQKFNLHQLPTLKSHHVGYSRTHSTKESKKKTKIGQRTFIIIENHGVLVPIPQTHYHWSVNTRPHASTKGLACMMKLGKKIPAVNNISGWILSNTILFLEHQIFHIIKGAIIPISLIILWITFTILSISEFKHNIIGSRKPQNC